VTERSATRRLSFSSNSGRDRIELVLPEFPSDDGEVLASVSIRHDFFARTRPLGAVVRDFDIEFHQYGILPAKLRDLLASLKGWLADETPVDEDIGAGPSWVIEIGPHPEFLTMRGKPAVLMSFDHEHAKLQYGFVADYSCVLEFTEGLERYLHPTAVRDA
jgi:hypothetical protein